MQEYNLLIKQVSALIEAEEDFIANMANTSSLLYHHLDQVNWIGFYLFKYDELVLGPFHGQVACTRIPVGKGVCGTAYAENKTLLVNDVHDFAGHIACDAASESEIVVPFKTHQGNGVLDVDSPVKSRFTEAEQSLFEGVVALFESKYSV